MKGRHRVPVALITARADHVSPVSVPTGKPSSTVATAVPRWIGRS